VAEPVQVAVEQLDRTDLLATDGRGQFGRGSIACTIEGAHDRCGGRHPERAGVTSLKMRNS
jgi:hypothetical protein